MNHPTIIAVHGHLRYRQLLQEAETERQYRQSRPERITLREQMGALLIWLGRQLQPSPPTAAGSKWGRIRS